MLGWSTSNVTVDLRRRRKVALLPKRVARDAWRRRLADKVRVRMGTESFISVDGSDAEDAAGVTANGLNWDRGLSFFPSMLQWCTGGAV